MNDFQAKLESLQRLAAPPRVTKKKRADRALLATTQDEMPKIHRRRKFSVPGKSYTAATTADLDELFKVSSGTSAASSGKKFSKRVRHASTVVVGDTSLDDLVPVSKRPKGFKSIVRNRQILSIDGMSDQFQTPEPLILNDYWVYFPVPQKTLFRDLLNLDEVGRVQVPAKPDVTADVMREVEYFEQEYSRLQKERASHLLAIGNLEKDLETSHQHDELEVLKNRVAAIDQRLETMEGENQERAFDHSKKVYQWSIERDVLEEPYKVRLKAENDRKTAVLEHIQHGLKLERAHMNNVQKSVFEVELNKSIEAVGGSDGQVPEISEDMDDNQAAEIGELKARVTEVLGKVAVSSNVKAKVAVNQTLIRNLMNPLRAHVPPTKGKYEKSGEFTKEKRASKVAMARPYHKTGKHIHDYQNPRDKEQRDKQIIERAQKLGVSPEVFRKSVLGLLL